MFIFGQIASGRKKAKVESKKSYEAIYPLYTDDKVAISVLNTREKMLSTKNSVISILFLNIVGNMSRVFSLKDNFITKFSILLSKNITPDFSKREKLKRTIERFDELFEEYPDWSFINSISDEKMELLMDKLVY